MELQPMIVNKRIEEMNALQVEQEAQQQAVTA